MKHLLRYWAARIVRVVCRPKLVNTSGSALVLFSLAAPALLGFVGIAVDCGRAVRARTQLQQVVDSAALDGASMLRLPNSTPQSIRSVIQSEISGAYGQDGSLVVDTNVASATVTVKATRTVPTIVLQAVKSVNISAQAQAQALNGSPTCVISLEPATADALSVDRATLDAPGCQVFSNSSSASSISLSDGARLNASFLCSSGGYTVSKGGSFSPVPLTDCPPVSDPLASRQPPAVDPTCVATAEVIAQSATLVPGTYCGGLTIGGYPKGYKPPPGSVPPKPGPINVTLQSGTYVIKDGPLYIHNNADVSGSGVTVFFTGTGAILKVQDQAILDLTAPSVGAMAGMLLFEDRTVPTGQTHLLNSRNAPNLLGTVYLSRNALSIGVPGKGGGPGQKVASTSAWTVIIARQLLVADQQGVVLNTNYGVTTVPPPREIVGPAAAISLVR